MFLYEYLWKQFRTLTASALVVGIANGVTTAALITAASSTTTQSSRQISAGYFFTLCAVSFALGVAAHAASAFLLGRIIEKTSTSLCERILSTALARAESIGLQRLEVALSHDILHISAGAAHVPTFCMQAAVVFICCCYLAHLSLPLFGYVAIYLLLGMTSFQYLTRYGRQKLDLSRRHWDRLACAMHAVLYGMKELKLNQAHRTYFFNHELLPAAAVVEKTHAEARIAYAAANAWGKLLSFGLIGALLFGAPLLPSIEDAIRTSYILTILYMIGFMQSMGSAAPVFGEARSAAWKLRELGLQLQHQERGSNMPGYPRRNWRSIELSGVSYRYLAEPSSQGFGVGPIDLAVRPGEIVFITGGNGSGKTTLAKVLCGLYQPESGVIKLDGTGVGRDPMEYRQLFSAVFSDFYLFDSVGAYRGAGQENLATMWLERLRLDHKVSIVKERLSTMNLSRGERKRLALLHIYMQARPICILDEWAADQDPYFKRVFYEQLLPEMAATGVTPIVITHDRTYYPVATHVVELTDGVISAERMQARAQ